MTNSEVVKRLNSIHATINWHIKDSLRVAIICAGINDLANDLEMETYHINHNGGDAMDTEVKVKEFDCYDCGIGFVARPDFAFFQLCPHCGAIVAYTWAWGY